MKPIITYLFFIAFPFFAFCQENIDQQKNPYDVNFNMITQQEPYFVAGDQALYTYFYNNIIYSSVAKANNINGQVMISFDVLPDSTIKDILVLSGVGYGIDEEVVRLVMPLKYAPGIQSGEKAKMNVILTVPVRAE